MNCSSRDIVSCNHGDRPHRTHPAARRHRVHHLPRGPCRRFPARVPHRPALRRRAHAGRAARPRHHPRRRRGERFNVYAALPGITPDVVLSTHMDTVPPFFGCTEDDEFLYGRGSCDAKGIIAAQVAAADRLREAGVKVGLLFVVGEERDSAGAKVANKSPRARASSSTASPPTTVSPSPPKAPARRAPRQRPHGPLRLSRARRIRHRQARRRAQRPPRHAPAVRARDRPIHPEHRPHQRRPRAQRHRRQSRGPPSHPHWSARPTRSRSPSSPP